MKLLAVVKNPLSITRYLAAPGELTEGAKPSLGGCPAAHLVAVRPAGRAACSGDRRSATRTSAGITAARASAQPGQPWGAGPFSRSVGAPLVGARPFRSRRAATRAAPTRTPAWPRAKPPQPFRAATTGRKWRTDWVKIPLDSLQEVLGAASESGEGRAGRDICLDSSRRWPAPGVSIHVEFGVPRQPSARPRSPS